MLKDYFGLIAGYLDMDFVKNHSYKLYELERNTDSVSAANASKYVYELLEKCGFADVERYALPCDGVTTYDDCTMPQAWERTGRSTLEILDPAVSPEERLIADTDKEPLNAVIWSPSTPPGGRTAELISLKSINSDDCHEAAGKIVLCHYSPGGMLSKKLACAGAVGLVSYVEDIFDSNPDDIRWMNGCGWNGWYYVKGNLALWNFSITPRRGVALNKRLENGEKILLKAVMNTRVFDGETYTVTARIPGKSNEEIAMFAHMYEPFVADDAAGVIHSIAVAKALRDMAADGVIPALEKSIRVVFSMERYGFSEYFWNRKRSGKIISAVNMDSMCHSSLKVAGVLPELRNSPVSAPCFDVVLIRELLRKHYPEFLFREAPGNLSDDTFAAEEPFNIPTCWLHTPPAVNRHHNTGEVFAGVDWEIGEQVARVMIAYHARLATLKGVRKAGALAKEVLKGVKVNARREFTRLTEDIRRREVNSYAANVIGDYLVDCFTGQVAAVNRLVPGAVKAAALKKEFNAIRRKFAPQSLELDVYDMRNSECKMCYMYVTRNPKIRQIMSLTRMPEGQRGGFIAHPEMLLLALLDGKRNLYEAYVISNFVLKRKNDFKETAGLISYFKRLEPYGYYDIRYAGNINAGDIRTALNALGVAHSDKLVVHSSFGSLGGVEGGPAAVIDTLIEHCGKEGLLMMPSFNMAYYRGTCDGDVVFDWKNSPSTVGIITDEFRKHKDVVRSLNPTHSMAVYGKENFHWVKDHHKTLCFGEDSPLGRLEKAGGYALMISCSNAVTFMHVAEMTNSVHCLGKRTEEVNVKLPDGRIVPIRTWSWRGASCRAYDNNAIYDYMRKHNMITEVMVRHSLWQYFKLSDYRKAYEKTVMRNPEKGCMQCPILPRVCKYTVPGDWQSDKAEVRKNTTAFTGDWEV